MRTIKGQFTKHISVDNYTWAEDPEEAVVTPRSMAFIMLFEEWISWVGRKVVIHGMYRSLKLNKRFNGHPQSNHLKGEACDFHIDAFQMDTARFIKYAKKWKAICKKHGYVGEAGLYKDFMHFGIQTYSKSFYNWDSRSGKQINMVFNI